MTNTTTRRGLLKLTTSAVAYGAGATLVSVAGIVGTAQMTPAAHAATTTVSLSLSRLLAQHENAHAVLDRWYETTWNPAADAHREAFEAVPHVEIPVQGYRNVLDEDTPPHTYSTARKSDVARCKGIMSIRKDLQSTDPRWQDTYRAARRLTVATKWRERKLARIERWWDSLGLNLRESELWAPIHAATAAIIAFPVANAADALAKLDHMEQVGTCENDPDEYMRIVRSDLNRLLGREA